MALKYMLNVHTACNKTNANGGGNDVAHLNVCLFNS